MSLLLRILIHNDPDEQTSHDRLFLESDLHAWFPTFDIDCVPQIGEEVKNEGLPTHVAYSSQRTTSLTGLRGGVAGATSAYPNETAATS